MSVFHTTWGYAGTVDEIAEAKRFATSTPHFRVASFNDWSLAVSASTNRTIRIGPGLAEACGVGDSTGVEDTVAFAANGGGSNRLDALVATFDWVGHTVSFGVITGTTAPPLINGSSTTVDLSKINRIPGVRYDALLGIVKVRPGVGLFTSGDLADCRMWAGFEGYALTGTSTYLTLLDTFPGALVQANDTNIVWERLAGGVWGIHRWVGTDKTTQPMLSLRNTGFNIPHNVLTQVNAWPDQVDHSGGLFTAAALGRIQCNAYGNVRYECHAFSDIATEGASELQISFPAGGGHYMSTMTDERQRNSGYVASGTLRQTITVPPVRVAPGDIFDMQIYQFNLSSATIAYQLWQTATYI
jgi:hypothetical protein